MLEVTPTQLEAAVHYAGHGFEVFPANPRTKAPMIDGGMNAATSDIDPIREWWSRFPDALVACRIPANQVVLDIDPRHGGDTTWTELQKAYATILSARVHVSGRQDGGSHQWFERPVGVLSARKLDEWARRNNVGQPVRDKDGNETGKWTSGIDILHHNHRYSILPPSPHPVTGKPYLWTDRGEPAEMPSFLAELITADPALTPGPMLKTIYEGDSIADWFTETSTWPNILEPAGWTVISGDGHSDGTKWRHPNATAAYSATIRHGCLFVYTANTPFPETEPGYPDGITRFRAWATLNHRGNLTDAARAAHELRDGPRPANTSLGDLIAATATDGAEIRSIGDSGRVLPTEFFDERPSLQRIRQAAYARRRSASAVLLATLARVAAVTPPTVVLPAISGGVGSLNFLGGIVSRSGGGKSSSNSVARELLPIDRKDVVADVPPGSGEGLAELFFEMTSEEGPDGKTRKVKRKTKTGALVYLDEGQALAEMGNRKGATLLPVLRSAWSGELIGQSNATQETHRVLQAHDYRLAIIVGFQLEYAADLMGDTGGGTPQRFVFASAIDPNIPDERPPFPEPIEIDVPAMVASGTEIEFDPGVFDEIDQRALAAARGDHEPDSLDTHADLVRMKVAALLGILDDRLSVTADDWRLAGVVMSRSNSIRRWAIEHHAAQQRSSERAYAVKLADRAAVVDDSAEQRALISGAKSIGRKVHNTQGECAKRDLQSAAASKHRKLVSVDEMISYAVDQGWIEMVGDRYQPGESRPA